MANRSREVVWLNQTIQVAPRSTTYVAYIPPGKRGTTGNLFGLTTVPMTGNKSNFAPETNMSSRNLAITCINITQETFSMNHHAHICKSL